MYDPDPPASGGSFDCCPVIITITAAGWQGQVHREGDNTETERVPANVQPCESESLQMFFRKLRGGNHLCLQDSSWTVELTVSTVCRK